MNKLNTILKAAQDLLVLMADSELCLSDKKSVISIIQHTQLKLDRLNGVKMTKARRSTNKMDSTKELMAIATGVPVADETTLQRLARECADQLNVGFLPPVQDDETVVG